MFMVSSKKRVWPVWLGWPACPALVVLAVFILGRPGVVRAEGGKPNILIILTDQQSATMLSITGNRWLKTPAMDNLARQGVRFEKAYPTNPVCTPSRFSMFTGHYPTAVQMRANGSSRGAERYVGLALGHAFRAAGYRTVYGGKVHLPGPMNDITACGFERLTTDERDELADKCAEFLAQRHDKPFLLVASFINPHDICYQALLAPKPRPDMERRHPAVRVMRQAEKIPPGVGREEFFRRLCPPLPDNFEPTDPEPRALTAALQARSFRYWVRQNWSEQQWRLHRWTYCRLTERVDRQVGRVLQALHEAGLEQNTIVVFTSDHGDMDGSHRMEHKSMTYEQAARVPLIIRYPPLTRPGLVDDKHLVSTGLDLYPTLCDLAGVQPPKPLPGRSLGPLLAGRQPRTWRRYLMIQTQFSFGLTDGRYKYTFFDVGEQPEEMLCDLASDPGEMKNLAASESHTTVLARMRAALAEQFEQYQVRPGHPLPGQGRVEP